MRNKFTGYDFYKARYISVAINMGSQSACGEPIIIIDCLNIITGLLMSTKIILRYLKHSICTTIQLISNYILIHIVASGPSGEGLAHPVDCGALVPYTLTLLDDVAYVCVEPEVELGGRVQ